MGSILTLKIPFTHSHTLIRVDKPSAVQKWFVLFRKIGILMETGTSGPGGKTYWFLVSRVLSGSDIIKMTFSKITPSVVSFAYVPDEKLDRMWEKVEFIFLITSDLASMWTFFKNKFVEIFLISHNVWYTRKYPSQACSQNFSIKMFSSFNNHVIFSLFLEGSYCRRYFKPVPYRRYVNSFEPGDLE